MRPPNRYKRDSRPLSAPIEGRGRVSSQTFAYGLPSAKERHLEIMCGVCLAEKVFSHREFEVMQKNVSIL